MALTAKDAVRELWYRGSIQYKLHAVQKKMLASYVNQNERVTIICCSRRLGKSFLLTVLAVEQCLKYPNSIVKYVCPQKKMVKTIIEPIMRDIFKDCPAELKPEFKSNDYIYTFPNGSQIHLAGTDGGHHESLRGSRSDLWIIDEAGFCDDLKYLITSILAPTALTTGGKGILASTPSKMSDHEFITEYMEPAQEDGKLILYTLYDNPMLTERDINDAIAMFPLGKLDPDFQREYLCKIVNSSERRVFSEFTEEAEKKLVKDHPRPPFFDAYASMDIGGTDQTGLLFAYYDFKNAAVVIEDELVFSKETNGKLNEFRIDSFVEQVRKKEQSLWTSPLTGEFKPPYLRVADNNNKIFLSDLTFRYNLHFNPTRKDNREAAINSIRVRIAEGTLIINPRCTALIAQLKFGRWAKNRKEFARSKEHGHFDLLAALIYLVRNIQETKNPYPSGYGLNREGYFLSPQDKQRTKSEQTWSDLFKIRKHNKQR
jgi:hypothetical protein